MPTGWNKEFAEFGPISQISFRWVQVQHNFDYQLLTVIRKYKEAKVRS